MYTCGENSYHQLGHLPPPPRLLAPAPVGGRGTGGLKLPSAVGVAAGRYHSIFWTEETLYTWGLNAGQLGHLKVSASFVFCFFIITMLQIVTGTFFDRLFVTLKETTRFLTDLTYVCHDL